MTIMKPGAKVQLKKLESWVIPQETVMTVLRVGDFSSDGVPQGALCEWRHQGEVYQKVYPLSDLILFK